MEIKESPILPEVMSDTGRELHESEIKKNEADAEKIAAETGRIQIEQLKLQREAEKLEAEAEKARQEAREHRADADVAAMDCIVAEYKLEREKEKRDRELSAFQHKRVYNFSKVVTYTSVTECINELNYWDHVDPKCHIEIVFDSPGGSVFDGLNLFDYIQELRRKGHHVTTHTRGMAASMAGILLQAGDVRTMSAESWILIHEISTIAGGKIGDIEDEVELVKKIQSRVLDIFAKRSDGKISKTTLARRWRRKDWWVDSTEALKLGLVDEVR